MSLVLGTVGMLTGCVPPTDAQDARAQYEAYIARSLKIVTAGAAGEVGDVQNVVDDDAEFRLGAGDVGLPFENGLVGVVALARRLNASEYSYPGWDFMNFAQDVCEPTKVEIRFIEATGKTFSNVTFSYAGGVLVSALGWTYSLNTGNLNENANG